MSKRYSFMARYDVTILITGDIIMEGYVGNTYPERNFGGEYHGVSYCVLLWPPGAGGVAVSVDQFHSISNNLIHYKNTL